MEAEQLPRTVVVKPCCIGDCVMALPAVDALAKSSSHQKVTVLAGAHSSAVFSNRSTVAKVIPCPEQTSVAAAGSWVRCLRGQGAIDRLAILDRSRLLWLASTVSGIPFRHHLEPKVEETRHESEVYLDLVRSMGVEVGASSPSITPSVDSHRLATNLVPATESYAIIHPGGGQNPGTTMLEKRWPVERYTEVARWLASRNIRVILTGSVADIPLCATIAQHLSFSEVTIVAGEADLMTTAALAMRAALYVGSDTGVSHIAAAAGAPVIAIFGPTNPGRYRPIGERVIVLSPAESWNIVDTDLRNRSSRLTDVSVLSVTTAHVIEAIEAILAAASSVTLDR